MSFVASVKHVASSLTAEATNGVKDVEKFAHSKTVEGDFARALDETKGVGSAVASSPVGGQAAQSGFLAALTPFL